MQQSPDRAQRRFTGTEIATRECHKRRTEHGSCRHPKDRDSPRCHALGEGGRQPGVIERREVLQPAQVAIEAEGHEEKVDGDEQSQRGAGRPRVEAVTTVHSWSSWRSSPVADAAIVFDEVTKRYGETTALRGLDFAVARGALHPGTRTSSCPDIPWPRAIRA